MNRHERRAANAQARGKPVASPNWTAEKAERFIAERRASLGRACGDCSLCCNLIAVASIGKPANEWCQHCRPGAGGCAIYDNRPPPCRSWACEWLVDGDWGDEWRPTQAKIVVHFDKDASTANKQLKFAVDPSVPDRWRTEPYYQTIKQQAWLGLLAERGVYFETYVNIGERHWLILPDRVVDVTGHKFYFAFQTATVGKWDVNAPNAPTSERTDHGRYARD
jgi:hypothetical protein